MKEEVVVGRRVGMKRCQLQRGATSWQEVRQRSFPIGNEAKRRSFFGNSRGGNESGTRAGSTRCGPSFPSIYYLLQTGSRRLA